MALLGALARVKATSTVRYEWSRSLMIAQIWRRLDSMGSIEERRAAAEAVVQAWLADVEVPYESGTRRGEYVLQLPGEAKLRTTVSVVVGDRGLRAVAFVVRRPDENHEEFYRWLLARNARLPGVAFALDRLGDVYLVGRLPLAAVSVDSLDEVLGVILSTADASFNDLLALGFATSIRKEWAWRLSRGEPTGNLAAFEHLRED
jgi:hypothetical protein